MQKKTMKWWTFFFLPTVFLLLGQIIYGQTTLNSANLTLRSRLNLLIKSKDIAKATILLDSAEQFDKNVSNPLIKYYRAVCLYESKRFEDAIQICSDEITNYTQTDSLLRNFYYLKINAYRELEKFTNAIYDNQKLIKLFPKDIQAYHNISYLFGEVGDYKGCFDALEISIKLEPNNFEPYNNLSYYSAMVGEYNKAVYYATEGLKLTKDSLAIGGFLNNRGFGKIGLKKYESAQIDIDESLKYKPINPYAYYNKALIYIQLKEFDEACKNLNKAKELGGINLTSALLKQYCEK